MINRRELAEFQEFLVAQAARLIDVLNRYTRRMTNSRRESVVELSIVLAWRYRESFQPDQCSRVEWFAQFVEAAAEKGAGLRFPSWDFADDERELLEYLEDDYYEKKHYLPAEQRAYATDNIAEDEFYDAQLKAEFYARFQQTDAFVAHSENCPPCWRCRYFDGWLPAVDLVKREHVEAEITAACWSLDTAKVRIAKWVSGKYPVEFTEIEDEPS